MSVYIFSAFVDPVIIILILVHNSLIQYIYLSKKKHCVGLQFGAVYLFIFYSQIDPVLTAFLLFTHFSHFYFNPSIDTMMCWEYPENPNATLKNPEPRTKPALHPTWQLKRNAYQ